MKRVIYEAPTATCDPNHVVTQDDLNKLEKHLDQIWNKLGIDIAFTKHFLDRVNDARNGRQITLCELARIFIETFRQHGKKLTTISAREWEAVLSDKTTNVNVPFVLKHNGREVEIVAKTVMRKPNFHTPDPKLMVAHYSRNGDNSMKNQKDAKPPIGLKTLREWAGFGLPQVDPVGGMSAADDVNVNTTKIEDPEVLNMLNGFLASLCQRQFINPYYPIHLAWIKLSAVNLSFPIRGLDLGGDSGVVYVPVTHQGGRLGKNLDGSWADNDGISEKIPGGLMLKIEYSLVEGMYSVALALCTEDQSTGLDADADLEVELDVTDIDEELNEAGTYIPQFSNSSSKFMVKFLPNPSKKFLDAVKDTDSEQTEDMIRKIVRTGKLPMSYRILYWKDGSGYRYATMDTTSLKALGVTEDVQTGTSDYSTADYPFDKTFQPTQDGETIFDSVNEAEERPKVKRGKYGREEWPSPSEWERYYKDKPLSALHKARETAMNGLHKVGPNLDKKNGLMDKIRGLSAAIQNHPKAADAAAKYEKQKQASRAPARKEDFQSFMKKAKLNKG